MSRKNSYKISSRRNFLKITGLGALSLGLSQVGCSGIGKNQVIFGDECSGTSIDPGKWDINVEDELNSELTHYHALELHTRKTAGTSAIVRSAVGSEKGVFSFSAFSDIPVNLRNNTPLPVTTRFGLYIDADNRIEFFHKLSGDYMLAYRIVKEGETVYETENVAKEMGQFKIIITSKSITACIWDNDKWIEIGEMQEQTIKGKKHIFMSTEGNVPTKMSIRDCYITAGDFTSVTPVAQTVLDAVDVRSGGAIPNGETDCAAIINKILAESNVVIQNGRFLVNSAILIPSNRILYIRNATVRLGDQAFDNIFRNKEISAGSTNIKILGLGNAVLDGNAANNNRRSNTYPVPPEILDEDRYKINIGFFCNVSDFEIAGLNEVDRQCYFMTLQDDSFGKIHDIYNSLYVRTQNQDGIQVIYGSHDIELYNISGYYGDDVTSIFIGTKRGTPNYPTSTFPYGDVHDIYWHDFHVYYCSYHSIIFICGDGNKIYNCRIENFDVNYNLFFTYLGLGDRYNTVLPAVDEFHDLTFDNIVVNGSASALAQIEFNASMKNISFRNFKNNAKSPLYTVKNPRWFSNPQTVRLIMENVYINGEQIK